MRPEPRAAHAMDHSRAAASGSWLLRCCGWSLGAFQGRKRGMSRVRSGGEILTARRNCVLWVLASVQTPHGGTKRTVLKKPEGEGHRDWMVVSPMRSLECAVIGAPTSIPVYQLPSQRGESPCTTKSCVLGWTPSETRDRNLRLERWLSC